MVENKSERLVPTHRVLRQPKQQRSKARVERLIAAADEVLATEGYGALTVRRIADAAGVPVGSIYQFFPDKHAIVEVLTLRYLERFAATMDALVQEAREDRWDDPVGVIVDVFVDIYRDNPGFRAIWLDRHLSPDMVAADERNDDLLADGLRRIMVTLRPDLDNDELTYACRVAVYIGGSLLRRAFRADPNGDPVLINEIKRVERLYLADFIDALEPPASDLASLG